MTAKAETGVTQPRNTEDCHTATRRPPGAEAEGAGRRTLSWRLQREAASPPRVSVSGPPNSETVQFCGSKAPRSWDFVAAAAAGGGHSP